MNNEQNKGDSAAGVGLPLNAVRTGDEGAGLFRKKPVVISAIQYTEAIRDAYLFDGVPLPAGVVIPSRSFHPPTRKVWSADAYIQTLEGRMEVAIGDWVITGVKGEHYPCKPDIFAATYEPASLGAVSVPSETAAGAQKQDHPSEIAELEQEASLMRARNERLQQERDALLEALKGAVKALDSIFDEMTVGERYTNAGQYLIDALPPARAAIAKVEGRA